jgi:hypothetical protein
MYELLILKKLLPYLFYTRKRLKIFNKIFILLFYF